MSRVLSWVSAGAASAVATMLSPEAVPVYCETGAEHPDNERFLLDCEAWFGRTITRLRSEKYASTWDVWEKRRFLAGINGAVCTLELKVIPRLAFQHPHDEHVFGYTADAADVKRSHRLRENFPEMRVRFPLIESGLTKQATLAMVERAGIRLPALYGLGFTNNNCIPCVKATSPGYWATVRLNFPEQFARMAKLARDLDVRLCRIAGERAFIDEIPADQPITAADTPSCDMLCAIAEQSFLPDECRSREESK